MARYKVDKKLFEEKQLQDKLKQIELQGKYLRDEPLKRSEVDYYNKLQAASWAKSTLVSFGMLFVTLITFIILILLGNLLFTQGKSGVVDGFNIDSEQAWLAFQKSEQFPEAPLSAGVTDIFYYELNYDELNKKDSKGKTPIDKYFNGINPLHKDSDKVTILYKMKSEQSKSDIDNIVWTTTKVKGTYGTLLNESTETNWSITYVLDNKIKSKNFTELLDGFYSTMPDGTWAKTIVSARWLGNSMFLVFVLGILYFAVIIGYGMILVVGIRYVVKSIITLLRKTGYLVSDFAQELVSSVKDELPIIDTDPIEEVSFDDMKKQLEERLKRDRETEEEALTDEEVTTVKTKIKKEKQKNQKKAEAEENPYANIDLEEVDKEPEIETKTEETEKVKEVDEKSPEDEKDTSKEIGDIFDM